MSLLMLLIQSKRKKHQFVKCTQLFGKMMPLWSMRGVWVCDSNMSSKCVKLQLDSPQGPNPCPCKRVWDEVWNQGTGAKVELEEDVKWRGYEWVSLEEALLLMSAQSVEKRQTTEQPRPKKTPTNQELNTDIPIDKTRSSSQKLYNITAQHWSWVLNSRFLWFLKSSGNHLLFELLASSHI